MSDIPDQLEAVLGTTGGGYLRDEDVTSVMAAVVELRRLRRMVNIAQQKIPAEMLDAEERAERAEAELLDTNAEVVRLRRIVENVQSKTALDIVAEKMAAEDELARIVKIITNCRETAELQASPDGPTGDVTNLLAKLSNCERQAGYLQESVAEWSAAAAGHVETIEVLNEELAASRETIATLREEGVG
jgi:chromosome segregation ATPase